MNFSIDYLKARVNLHLLSPNCDTNCSKEKRNLNSQTSFNLQTKIVRIQLTPQKMKWEP